MYLRCPTCKHSARFDPTTVGVSARCRSCDRVYPLDKLGQLGATLSERSERAIEFARSEGIDLASAYTVLLGIASLEEARAFEAGAGQELHVAADASGRAPHFDPGFRGAVMSGHLTPRQAVERGDRVRYASTMSQRHGFSMDVAFLVADGRVSLPSALQTLAAPRTRSAEAIPAVVARRSAWPVALVAIAVLAGWGIWRDRRRASDDGTRTNEPSIARQHNSSVSDREILANAAGQVTSVTAATPEAVLEVYCRSTRAVEHREPVRIEPTKNGWRGIFSEAGAYYGILMRPEPATGRVTAGDGRLPLLPELVAIPRGTT